MKTNEVLRRCCKVIAEQGFEKATIRKIAGEMGTSVAALYYYYASKEDLLFAIQYRSFRELVAQLEVRLKGETDPERKLRILIENHLDYFSARMNELVVCSHEINTLQGKAYRKVREIRRRYYNIAVGLVRELSRGISPSLAALNLFGMLNWIHMWFDPKKGKSARDVAQSIGDLFLHGIRGGAA